jgi:hypothetical protein
MILREEVTIEMPTVDGGSTGIGPNNRQCATSQLLLNHIQNLLRGIQYVVVL